MTSLSRLLRPKSIAVLGAGWALNVIEQCRKMGFDGPVWPVHPTKSEIGGLKAYASLADLPGVPDATFIGVNRFASIDVVRELAAMGAGPGYTLGLFNENLPKRNQHGYKNNAKTLFGFNVRFGAILVEMRGSQVLVCFIMC